MNSRVSLERIRLANVVNQLVEYGGTKMEMWYCVAAVVTGTFDPGASRSKRTVALLASKPYLCHSCLLINQHGPRSLLLP